MDTTKLPKHKSSLVLAPLTLCVSIACHARGVSPYLPLNMSPDIERKIERVLILGDKPIMHRPIAAAIVLDALPKACQKDEQLCEEVRSYLDLYMHTAKITEARVEGTLASGESGTSLPNQRGMPVSSKWAVAASAYYQPSDYLLVNGSAVAYQGRINPAGSVVSMGFDFAQLDIGYRDHWFSPNMDSSMLMSTEAPAMPSITLSNYRPLTPLGISYEIFLARMSSQQNIIYQNTTTTGHPNLAGIQLSIEPASGYAIAINRLMQYGGGARGGTSIKQFYKALFDNSAANHADSASGTEFGNQEASVTASALFPSRVPFAVHIEYAAEDNTYAGNKYFGDTAFTLGMDFPELWKDFDFSYEVSEWQNAWYVHHLYPQGMSNDGFVLGHWFGDERTNHPGIGGHSQMIRAGYRFGSSSYLQAIYRDMTYVPAWAGVNTVVEPDYRLHEGGLRFSTGWHHHNIAAELFAGRDIAGKSFARLSGSFDIASFTGNNAVAMSADDSSTDTSIFVDAGINRSRRNEEFYSLPTIYTDSHVNYHAGIGARRRVSDHGDLGVRLDSDQVAGHSLLSIRLIDYRYRLIPHLAIGGFYGVSRYEIGLPAYGWYRGVNIQYMNLFKNWDLCLDAFQAYKLNRDAVLADDLPSNASQPRVYFNVDGSRLYFSRQF